MNLIVTLKMEVIVPSKTWLFLYHTPPRYFPGDFCENVKV